MISYAQNLEDVVLNRVFKSKPNGFFIDVGAHHPEDLSVTKFFYDLGWSGINIEPIELSYAEFTKRRERDINLNIGIGQTKGIQKIYSVDGFPELTSLDYDIAFHASVKTGGAIIAKEIQIMPLNEVFANFVNQPVDFLKIDVEGTEKDVILSLDWAKYRPLVLVIESTIPNSGSIQDWDNPEANAAWHEWEKIIVDSGYSFVYYDGLNRFYIRNEDECLRKNFYIPISPIQDDYVFYREIDQSAKNNSLNSQFESLKSEKEFLESEFESLKLNFRSLVTEKESLVEKHFFLKEVYETLHDKYDAVNSKYESLKIENSLFRKRLELKDQELDLLNKTMQAKDQEIETIKKNVEYELDLKDVYIQAKDTEIDQLKKQVHQELDFKNKSILAKDKEIGSLREQLGQELKQTNNTLNLLKGNERNKLVSQYKKHLPSRLAGQLLQFCFHPFVYLRKRRDILEVLHSGLFDDAYYLEQNPDLYLTTVNLLQHYMRYGWKEGRNPNTLFDAKYYLENNPDVKEAGVNPLLHYIRYGKIENRKTSFPLDADFNEESLKLIIEKDKLFQKRFSLFKRFFFPVRSLEKFEKFYKENNSTEKQILNNSQDSDFNSMKLLNFSSYPELLEIIENKNQMTNMAFLRDVENFDKSNSNDMPWYATTNIPTHIPNWYQESYLMKDLVSNKSFWLNSKNQYGKIIAFSSESQSVMSSTKISIKSFIHPLPLSNKKWSQESFLKNSKKRIVQAGIDFRLLHAIFMLPKANYGKVLLSTIELTELNRMLDIERNQLGCEFRLPMLKSVDIVNEPIYNIENWYDGNVFFAHFYDSSADWIILKCIADHVPILVNHIPPMHEYFGVDYPLFYSFYDEAIEKASNIKLVIEAHEYLKERSKLECFKLDYFLQTTTDFIGK